MQKGHPPLLPQTQPFCWGGKWVQEYPAATGQEFVTSPAAFCCSQGQQQAPFANSVQVTSPLSYRKKSEGFHGNGQHQPPT